MIGGQDPKRTTADQTRRRGTISRACEALLYLPSSNPDMIDFVLSLPVQCCYRTTGDTLEARLWAIASLSSEGIARHKCPTARHMHEDVVIS